MVNNYSYPGYYTPSSGIRPYQVITSQDPMEVDDVGSAVPAEKPKPSVRTNLSISTKGNVTTKAVVTTYHDEPDEGDSEEGMPVRSLRNRTITPQTNTTIDFIDRELEKTRTRLETCSLRELGSLQNQLKIYQQQKKVLLQLEKTMRPTQRNPEMMS